MDNNGNNNNSRDYDRLDEEPYHEGIRFRGRCSGRLRHPRECSCGRGRALIRRGQRWHRLGLCRLCLRRDRAVGLSPEDREGAGV